MCVSHVTCRSVCFVLTIGYNCHLVSIDAELLHCFGAGVDKSQAVLFPGLKVELGYSRIGCTFLSGVRTRIRHFTVDEVFVRRWWWQVLGNGRHDLFDDTKIVLVVPVVQHDRSEINVVFSVDRAVNDHRAKESARILTTVVSAMVSVT